MAPGPGECQTGTIDCLLPGPYIALMCIGKAAPLFSFFASARESLVGAAAPLFVDSKQLLTLALILLGAFA